MSEHTYRLVEVVGSSPDGVDQAIRNAVEAAHYVETILTGRDSSLEILERGLEVNEFFELFDLFQITISIDGDRFVAIESYLCWDSKRTG